MPDAQLGRSGKLCHLFGDHWISDEGMKAFRGLPNIHDLPDLRISSRHVVQQNGLRRMGIVLA